MEKVKQETVFCPKCRAEIMGLISELKLGSDGSFPFLDYTAYCPDCDYFITESEWEHVAGGKK